MHSLRARLNTAFAVPTVVIVLVLVAVAYMTARQGLEEELADRLEAVGQVLATDMSEGIDASQLSRLDGSMNRVRTRFQDRLQKVVDATEVRRVFIFDREATTLIDTADEDAFGATLYRVQADRREVEATFEESIVTSGPLFRTEDGAFHKTAYAPVIYEGETVAAIGVEADAGYFELLTGFATVLAFLGAVGVAVVVGIGFWFSKLLSRPVDVLVEGAKRLAAGELETPVVEEARKQGSRSREFDFLMESFEEMRQSIVERDRQMQMMLGGIAHEVRNPLGGMELFCGLLKEDLKAAEHLDDRGDKIEMVERIEREVDYLERVVETFLDFARPGELVRERIDAGDFFDEIAEVVDGDLQKADCRLVVDIEDGLELTVDGGKMRRAVINAVRNACQAYKGQEGDEVCVRGVADGDQRIIEIADRGCGIEEEKLDELCQPFFTTREKGSGLGLALIRRIVDEHGGELEIESAVGDGTCVRMRLPFDSKVERSENEDDEQMEVPEGWLG